MSAQLGTERTARVRPTLVQSRQASANALLRSRAPAQAGNLFVTYNRSSFTFDEFISAWIATIPSRVHHAVQAVLGTGEGVYDVRNGPERLGDFNAIGRDPLMAVVLFAINKYATPSNAFPAERPHGSGGLTRARRGRALSWRPHEALGAVRADPA